MCLIKGFTAYFSLCITNYNCRERDVVETVKGVKGIGVDSHHPLEF
jgi:hypothetical protein